MSVKITIDDREIRKITRNIDKYNRRANKAAEEAVVNNALKAQREAKQNILIDTGRARRNTRVKFQNKNGFRLGAIVGTFVNYAIYIERKKPYLFPAFERARNNLLRDLRRIFRN